MLHLNNLVYSYHILEGRISPQSLILIIIIPTTNIYWAQTAEHLTSTMHWAKQFINIISWSLHHQDHFRAGHSGPCLEGLSRAPLPTGKETESPWRHIHPDLFYPSLSHFPQWDKALRTGDQLQGLCGPLPQVGPAWGWTMPGVCVLPRGMGEFKEGGCVDRDWH